MHVTTSQAARYPPALLCSLFLIARRQLRHPGVRAVLSGLYWTTFFPLRMGLYPYLLLRFWWEMQVRGREGWGAGSRAGLRQVPAHWCTGACRFKDAKEAAWASLRRAVAATVCTRSPDTSSGRRARRPMHRPAQI